ncbi:DUF3006 family protein [Natrialba taiwanensis]|uniref:DUF3006 family protein n=1 Tax=Natrialba taiwanensis DSM 12281 TaxID=1230458 RepID=L9ZVA8_9EURY|nr:DUF3006 family protein [Natrialba taiwanensis]ELY89996.1 hypothetical protein C484_12491 [Natrialba taiwanensis DSM 12281]
MNSRATYTAVLDRIVDGETAVLLLEDDGDPVAEVTLPVDRVPAAGQHDGAVFEVTVDETTDDETANEETTNEVNSVVDLEYREDEEDVRRERTQDRFDRLSERLSEE